MTSYSIKTDLGIIAFLALILAVIVGAPLIFIWSLNTLFSLGIPYTFWSWLAAFALTAFLGGSKYGPRIRK